MTIVRQSYILHVNPEPWKTPPFSPARKNGKMIVVSGRDETSFVTKEAIAAALREQGAEMLEPPYWIHLYFWRHREHYVSEKGRNMHKREADATNMQKLTEDAMQGVLINNDVNVRIVTSQVVGQDKVGPGMIVILIEAGLPEELVSSPIIPARFDQGGHLTARIAHARSTAAATIEAADLAVDNSWGADASDDF